MKAKSAQSSLATRERCGIVNLDNRPVLKAGRWGMPRIEKFLKDIKQTATCRLGEAGALTASWADEALENIHTEDWMKSKGEVVMAAARGDREAQALHAEAIQITTTNVVTATSVWMNFFERQTLGPADLLVINPDTHGQAITIDAIGQDGGRSMIQSQPEDPTPIFIPIHMRGTPWIEYPLNDLYKGVVKDMALAQFDLARDKAYRLDTLAGTYITVGEANTRYVDTFTTTGAGVSRDIQLHPGVVLANLPTGNLITLTGNTISSFFRKDVFDAIIEYGTSWGDSALEAGTFRPLEIVVSSKHMTDWLKQVNLTTEGNMLVNQVFESGFVMKYAGYDFIITGSNKISPTHGVAYVRYDQPIGIYAEKPSIASDIVDETPALVSQNKGRTCSNWAESFALPLHWRKRTVAIRFRTAS